METIMKKKRKTILKNTGITMANIGEKTKIKSQPVKMYSRSQKQAKNLNLPTLMMNKIM